MDLAKKSEKKFPLRSPHSPRKLLINKSRDGGRYVEIDVDVIASDSNVIKSNTESEEF